MKNIRQKISFKSDFPVRLHSTTPVRISKSQVIGLGPNSTLLKQYKDSLGELMQVEMEAAVGHMLGDASLQTQNKGKAFIMKFEWSNKHKAYLSHVWKVFDR